MQINKEFDMARTDITTLAKGKKNLSTLKRMEAYREMIRKARRKEYAEQK